MSVLLPEYIYISEFTTERKAW